MKEKADFTGVEQTTLITLYLRAWESRSKDSILGDHFAAEAVKRIDYDFGKLMVRGGAGNRFTLALRSRQLDEWAADFLRRHPDAVVLHLGCGLDSRALRLDLPPRVRWFDIDLPDVIDLRRKIYPEPDGYRTIGASVTDPGWLDEIPADRPVLIIAEGLVMHLTENDNKRLFQQLTERFGTGELIFDGFAPWVIRMTQRMSKSLARRGYTPYWTAIRDPRDVERWNPRFTYIEDVPFVSLYARIPARVYRTAYRLMNTISVTRNFYRMFRFGF
ncbi:methyltransferase (TIGR00027 family) [Thermocatellispora tengchongensis]|uniref:Methyltransferase (TIGR00027 family) n=1 Tax=Thermocatellispora tengchongensis TaxID=1073253 RepID=A0A840PGW0_9ACTN|nr:class I SAM-dependent methyltransferase [Thermocatellispora tengchongensis]MBB5136750.1 methyltransferase (TIGR00027 family) [Thermocatellispora tengchongensis]